MMGTEPRRCHGAESCYVVQYVVRSGIICAGKQCGLFKVPSEQAHWAQMTFHMEKTTTVHYTNTKNTPICLLSALGKCNGVYNIIFYVMM